MAAALVATRQDAPDGEQTAQASGAQAARAASPGSVEASGGPYAAALEDVQAAAKRIAAHAHVTPVLTCSTIDHLAGRSLFFKCEVFQKGGAFKFRGACNSVMLLSDEQAARGVATHSSGNHAAALALAAKLRGIPAHIVVPSNAPGCKVDAVREYGGRVVFCAPTLAAREEACGRVLRETGASMVPPYDYGPVMAGQGTIGLELLEQVPNLDAIVVPVSGGGMLSGIAIAAKALRPAIKVVAAEPRGTNDAADAAASKAAGARAEGLPKTETICDGLQAQLGDLTWPAVRDLVDQVVVVGEEETVAAMKLIMERMKVVVEPSAAVGLAAVLSRSWAGAPGLAACRRVAIVLSGGNVDFGARRFWQGWLDAAGGGGSSKGRGSGTRRGGCVVS